jgi:hypothetical protein
MFLWTEFGLTALAVALALASPNFGSNCFLRIEQALNRLAQRRGLAVLTIGVAALGVRLALLPTLPIPQPGVHDEFGYLLLADTFAHGRLTNPTHPMWVHFESFYILWQPTYTAKFYPAQGLIMAAGQVLVGHPFWGVWLSVGLMCAAVCWMLQGWLPPGWALLGGFLTVIRLGTFSYWANSYWGGAVAATGGALVLGALPRVKRSQRVRDALLMGLGFAILANSRPYEGLFLGLPIAAAMAAWMLRKDGPTLRLATRRIIAPLVLVLLLTACAMGYYFFRTTGSPWLTPYQLYERDYSPAPYFPWQALRPMPDYHHAVMRGFYQNTMVRHYEEFRSVSGMVVSCVLILFLTGLFYLGPALGIALPATVLALPYGFRWRAIGPTTRFLLLVCGATITGSMLSPWFLPHYAAPIASALIALVLQSMRFLRSQAGKWQPAGVFITRAIPSICVLMLALRVSANPLHLPTTPRVNAGTGATWCTLGLADLGRAAMLAKLQGCPGLQLAIVRYGPRHVMGFPEWVFNEADVDKAKVVWARDMGPARNDELLHYFRDRRAWLVEPDENPPRLSRYPCENTPGAASDNCAETGPTSRGHAQPVIEPAGEKSG